MPAEVKHVADSKESGSQIQQRSSGEPICWAAAISPLEAHPVEPPPPELHGRSPQARQMTETNKPIYVSLRGGERRQLRRISEAQKSEQRMALRARIILLASDGKDNRGIARELGLDVKTVRKWRGRFAWSRMAGLYDAPRSGRPPVFDATQRHEVFSLVVSSPPKPYTRWTIDLLADELVKRCIVPSIGRETISYWLRTADIKPHRFRYWLNSKDPQFQEKKDRVVKLYTNPPTDGIVLCIDEKPGIQVLERRHPTRPPARGRVRRLEFEYKRHGTVSLMAAFEVHSGRVRGECISRNDSETFIRFLKRLMRAYPKTKLYLVLDNGASHCSKATRAFLNEHSDLLVPVYLPTHASWLNQIEIWFSALSRHALRNTSFPNKEALRRRIREYIQHHNRIARPYRWKKGKPLKGLQNSHPFRHTCTVTSPVRIPGLLTLRTA